MSYHPTSPGEHQNAAAGVSGDVPPDSLGGNVVRPDPGVDRLSYAGRLANFGADGGEVSAPAVDEVTANPADRSHEIYRLHRDPKTYEVTVESDHGAAAYEAITLPEDWAYLQEQAEPQRGKTWVFFNPTMEGGGVVMLRPPLIRLMREHGIDAHWEVLEPIQDESKGEPFEFTKLMHNISQRQAGDQRITEEGKELHKYWADTENGPVLERLEHIRNADVFVFDDPQPLPLLKRLREINPHAKIIWRNHIDTDHDLMADPDTPQGEVASYLMDELGMRDVDAVMAHPVEQFIHPGMESKTWFGPATVDPFDNLNRHLEEAEVVEGIGFINDEITKKNAELHAAGREKDIQPLLSMDPDRKRLTLVARFDPSKGMDKAMEMGVRTRRKLRAQGVPENELPEVVIVGNGSVDDPDGGPMYEEVLRLRREEYGDEAQGITVMRLKHNYDAMNALMTRSTVIMQTSDAEGLENRVGDAIRHGKPVVISNRGGIKTQVVEGESGVILDYDQPGHDLERGAAFMAEMLTDPAAYAEMQARVSRQAATLIAREFTTTANMARMLRIANHLERNPDAPADRLWKMADIEAAAAADQARAAAAAAYETDEEGTSEHRIPVFA